MLFSLTQIQFLGLERHLGPRLRLVSLLSEPLDCALGSALLAEVTEEEAAAAAAVVLEVVAVEEEEVVVAAVAVVVAAVLGVRAGGSCISQREQSSSIHRESWT